MGSNGIVLDGGPWHPEEGEIRGSNPQPKHANANWSQTVSPMLPPGEYKRGVGWTCRSDSTFCQTTLVIVIIFPLSAERDCTFELPDPAQTRDRRRRRSRNSALYDDNTDVVEDVVLFIPLYLVYVSHKPKSKVCTLVGRQSPLNQSEHRREFNPIKYVSK